MGAQPLPGQQDFRLPFSFTAGVKDGGTTLSVASASFARAADVQALSFSDNGEASGDVVFAGYGLVVPESQNFGYDSYATLDVKDKIVVVLRYFPEDADQKTRQILLALLRPALQGDAGAPARRQGAARRHRTALAERRRDDSDELRHGARRLGHRRRERRRRDVAQALFAGITDKTLEQIQQGFDSGNPHVAGFALPGVTVTVKTAVVREKQEGFNVVGYLPATSRVALPKPWVGARRALRSPGPGQPRQLAGDQGRRRQDPLRRRRQRLRYRRGAGRRPRTGEEDGAVAARHARVLVGRGDRPDRLERLRHDAAGAERPARGLLQLRHGRADAGQQAHGAGRGLEPRLEAADRAGQRRRGLRAACCRTIRINRPTSRASTRRACRA